MAKRKKKRSVSTGTGRRFASVKPKSHPSPAQRRKKAPRPSKAERSLRDRILKFAYQERFKPDFVEAIKAYVQLKPDDDVLTIEKETDIPGFQEWYFHDFVTHTGERIIDLFAAEIELSLHPAQAKMLADWIEWNYLRLFEIQEVNPGSGVIVEDVLSGEVLEVNDISASYGLQRWMLFLARPLLTDGRLHFTGIGKSLTPLQKSDMMRFVRPLWEEYQTNHPQTNLTNFYRDHSLDLWHHVDNIHEESKHPPTALTKEKHPVVLARAHFSIHCAPYEIEDLLDECIEFNYAGPSAEATDALHYNWLMRGRSHVPENPNPIEGKGVILRKEVPLGPDQSSYPSLGDINLNEDRLVLHCISRERLEAGKVLLKEILGIRIQYQDEEFESLKERRTKPVDEEPPAKTYNPAIDTEEALLFQKKIVRRETERWLDEPSPNLGSSPRQAMQTPEGRKIVMETLKSIEYLAEQARQDGKTPPMDLDYLLSELGIEGVS